MKPVGIIANPASGKDIRRLVAFGSVFDNNEKTNIVKRLLMAMDSVGVEKVYFMPDYFHIGPRAMDDLGIALELELLDMRLGGTQDDSTRAAKIMNDLGVACIVTLGGDGTNRVVAKACADTPLLPISTGTNNVFPSMVEGTLAGLAAGVVASNNLPLEETTRRAPRLELWRDGELADIALVDVVVSAASFTATRAVWDASTILEIFLTRAEPNHIGFSAVGGHICPLPPGSGKGLHILIGPGERRVRTPIAPGLICWLDIASHRVFGPGEEIAVSHSPAMIALDGEREFGVAKDQRLTVRINLEGPLVVDIDRVLEGACQCALFVCDQENQGGSHEAGKGRPA
ncbi:MAG: NAD(+)/NADH kinase [Proteobacteria bacterium]|nr:NAD(+)/NADH kinase [Pseudomonadota bacterium]